MCRPSRSAACVGLSITLAVAVVLVLLPTAVDAFHVPETRPRLAISEAQPDIPWGGRAVAFAIHPGDADRALAASETGGLFATFDGGDSWSHVDGLPPHKLHDVAYGPDGDVRVVTAKFDARNLDQPATTYPNGTSQLPRTIAGSGIWVSTDGGSWTKPDTAEPPGSCPGPYGAGRSVAWGIDEMDGVFYAGTDCGLAVSDDLGATWDHLLVAGARQRVWSVAAHHGIVDVCSTAGHLRYDPSDGSWQDPGSESCPGRAISSIAASPDEADVLFRATVLSLDRCGGDRRTTVFESTDGGATWTDLELPRCKEQQDQPFVATPPRSVDGKFDLWAGNGFHLFRQADCEPDPQRSTRCRVPGSLLEPAWHEFGHGLGGSSPSHADVTDIAFPPDGPCPMYLGHHGGLDRTDDCGRSWDLAGSSRNGFHALQVYEVAGQIYDDHTDLYIGTQDNDIWARDEAGDWPRSICCENGGLQMARRVTDHDPQIVTGKWCGPCKNFWSRAHFQGGRRGWSDPPDLSGDEKIEGSAPLLVEPGVYVQLGNDTAGEIWLSENDDKDWQLIVALGRKVEAGMTVVGPPDDPILYVPFNRPGLAGAGLFKVTGFRDAPSGVPPALSTTVSTRADTQMRIASHGRQFQWPRLVAADPSDPDHVLASAWDIDTGSSGRTPKMGVTTDGGGTWDPLENLTDLVTGDGDHPYLFETRRLGGNDCCSQVSTINFDPDNPHRIFVGTEANGIFASFDGGGVWWKVPGSDDIPIVTDFFFENRTRGLADDVIWVSSYGRGLWKMTIAPPLLEEGEVEHKPDLDPDRFEANDGAGLATGLDELSSSRDHVSPIRSARRIPGDPWPFRGVEVWRWRADDLTLHNEDDEDFFLVELPDPTARHITHPGLPKECGTTTFESTGPGRPVGSSGPDISPSGGEHVFEGWFRVSVRGIPDANRERVRIYTPETDPIRLERLAEGARGVTVPCPRTEGHERLYAVVGEDPGSVDFPVRFWFVDYDLRLTYQIRSEFFRGPPEDLDWFRDRMTEKAAHLADMLCDGYPRCDDMADGFGAVHGPMPGDDRQCWADGPGCPMYYGFQWLEQAPFEMVVAPTGVGDAGGDLAGEFEVELLDSSGTPLTGSEQVAFARDAGPFAGGGFAAQAGSGTFRVVPANQPAPNQTDPAQTDGEEDDPDPGTDGDEAAPRQVHGQRATMADLEPGFYVLKIDGPHAMLDVWMDPPPEPSDRDFDGVPDALDPDPDRAGVGGEGPVASPSGVPVVAVGVLAVVIGLLVGVVAGPGIRERLSKGNGDR